MNPDTNRTLKKSPSAATRAYSLEDQQIHELANLLGSIDAASSGEVAVRRTALPSSLATAKLQKTLDRVAGGDIPTSGTIPTTQRTSGDLPSAPSGQIPNINATTSRFSSTTVPSTQLPPRTSTAPVPATNATVNTPNTFQDTLDNNVLRAYTDYCLQTTYRTYLHTVTEDVALLDSDNVSVSSNNSVVTAKGAQPQSGSQQQQQQRLYVLGADGQGLGALCDAFQFVPLSEKSSYLNRGGAGGGAGGSAENNAENHTPLIYGMTVTLKSRFAKERLLGVKDGGRIGFWRHVTGEAEKWTILRATYSNLVSGCHGRLPPTLLPIEDVAARNRQYVRLGDCILLQAKRSEHLLSVASAEGMHLVGGGARREVRLVYKERAGGGVGLAHVSGISNHNHNSSGMMLMPAEALQVTLCDSVPLPRWCLNRPYLVTPSALASTQLSSHLASPHQPRADHSAGQGYMSRMGRAGGEDDAVVGVDDDEEHREERKRYAEAVQRLFPHHQGARSDQQTAYRPAPSLRSSLPAALSEAVVAIPAEEVRPLATFTRAQQEHLLLRDFLLVCSGVEGRYLRIKRRVSSTTGTEGLGPITNTVAHTVVPELEVVTNPSSNKGVREEDEPGLDISLLHQFTSFLVPCATHFLCLRHYLALGTHLLNYRPGFTSHALGRAIKRLHLRDCDVVCCQLECLLAADKLTMQKAVFLLQQSGVVKEVQVLYRVCCVPTTAGGPTAADLVGGELLQHLLRVLEAQGDQQARMMVARLIEAAAQPFLQMLAAWIYRGELRDPYHEFFIHENPSTPLLTSSATTSTTTSSIATPSYRTPAWDLHYSLRTQHYPALLFATTSEHIPSPSAGSAGGVFGGSDPDGASGGAQGSGALGSVLGGAAQRTLLAGKYLQVVRACLEGAEAHTASHFASEEGRRPSTNSPHIGVTLPREHPLALDLQHLLATPADASSNATSTATTGADFADESDVDEDEEDGEEDDEGEDDESDYEYDYGYEDAEEDAVEGDAGRSRRRGVSRKIYHKSNRGSVRGSTSSHHHKPKTTSKQHRKTSQLDFHHKQLHGELPHQQPGPLSLVQAVDRCYRFASTTLLQLLEHRFHLSTHLTSLRRFFLLEHGDFFIQFMDTAETELRKDASDISLLRLSQLLQQSIATSTLQHDAHKDQVGLTLAAYTLQQHLALIQHAGLGNQNDSAVPPPQPQQQGLKGIEVLQLHYAAPWPVSLVLSPRALIKYQLLSRLVYFSKHVERRLLHAWQMHQQSLRALHTIHSRSYGGHQTGPAKANSTSSDRSTNRGVRGLLGETLTLRHRMLHFVQNFVYYITLEVINPRSSVLAQDLNRARDMDHLLDVHDKFLDTCLRECLLSSQDLLKVLSKLMTTALLFADHTIGFFEDCARATERDLETLQQQTQTTGNGHNTVRTSSTPPKGTLSRPSSFLVQTSNAANNAAENNANGENSAAARAATTRHAQRLNTRHTRLTLRSATLFEELRHETFQRLTRKLALNFDEHLQHFLTQLWSSAHRQHAQLAHLCVRLDYNGFYTSQFAT